EPARPGAGEPDDGPHRARRRSRAGVRDPAPRGTAADLAVVARRDRRIFDIRGAERDRAAMEGRGRRADGTRAGDVSAGGKRLTLLLPDGVTESVQTQKGIRTERDFEFDLGRLDGFATGDTMSAAAASCPDLARFIARQLAGLDHLADSSANVQRVHALLSR